MFLFFSTLFFLPSNLILFIYPQCAEKLGDTYNNIVGDVLLSSAIVAYLGPFTVEFRQVRDYLYLPCI